MLREIALGICTLHRLDETVWANAYGSALTVGTDGWIITFHGHGNGRFHCERCERPDGRTYLFDSSQRYGTDPTELLSTWEHNKLAEILAGV